MPVFREVGPEARERLARKGKGYQERRVYHEHLSQLPDGKSFEIRPDEGESLRRIKGNVSRAARELDLKIRYGETPEGTLLVWGDSASEQKGRGRRRRPPEGAD